jgi:oligopeptide transport system permease protein
MSNPRFERIGVDRRESEMIARPVMSYWQDAFRRLRKNKPAIAALCFLIVIALLAVFVPLIASRSYSDMIPSLQFRFDRDIISKGYLLGTDDFGRDLFVRLWSGARISLMIALIVVIIEGLIGALYGGIAGYAGGYVDMVMMRFVEILMAIPSMIYIILFMVIMGPGVHTIIIAMAITRWLDMAMIVRGEVLKLKEQEYVLASRSLGASPLRIVTKHLLPNAMGQIIVRLTLDIPLAIFTEAFLSFIGIGVPAPLASWGRLANEGYVQIMQYPYLFIIPAIMISVTTLAFNILGDGLRDALDPKLRK